MTCHRPARHARRHSGESRGDQTQRNALHLATGWIAEHGWVITEVIEQRPVTRADFTDTEYLQYFEQALTDSALRGWALGEPDFVKNLQKMTARRVSKSTAGRPLANKIPLTK